MKKLLIAVLLLVIVVGIGLVFFAGKLDGLIKQAIETEGTAALGSPVRVESVVTDLRQGKAAITGLSIANPPGYTAANAIELNTFSADVDYADQTITEIVIDQPVINAEQRGNKNNFQDLLDNMPATSEEAATSEDTDAGPEITIRRLALQKATINLVTSELRLGEQEIELGNRSFVMDDFIVTDLTGTAEDISNELVSRLTAHVSAQIQAYVADEVKSMATDRIKEEAQEKVNELIDEKLGDQLDKNLDEGLKDKLKGFKLDLGKKKG